jgi:hypothetical protein
MQTFGLTSRRTPLPNRCFARRRRAFTLISVSLDITITEKQGFENRGEKTAAR